MKKRMRIISLVLSCVLVIGFVSLSYGADFEPITGSAFGINPKLLNSSSIKAIGGQQVYISENGTRYRYNGNIISSSSLLSLSFGDFFSEIMASIAYSAKGITDRVSSYYYSLTTSDGGVSVNSSVGNGPWLSPLINQVYEFQKDFFRFQYKVLNDGIPSKMNENSDIDWTRNYLWKKYLTASSGSIPKLSSGGVYSTQSVNFSDMSVLGGIEALLYYTVTGATNGISLLVRDVRDNNAALDDYLYDSDLNPTLIPRTTVWQNMRDFWTNTSDHLAHLRYVLANDEDIQLRQQTVDQQNAYKTNFTASGATGRMSGSDIADTAAAGSELKSAFTSSASGRDAFNGFSAGTDGRWDWFSIEILNSLDTTINNRKSNDNLTNFLNDYYNEVIRYAD